MYKEIAAFLNTIHLHDESIEAITSYSPKHLQIMMKGFVLGFSGVQSYTSVPTPSFWLHEKLIVKGAEGCSLVVETHTGEMTIHFTKMHCVIRPELLVIFPPLDCTLAEYYRAVRGGAHRGVVNRHEYNSANRRKPRQIDEITD